MILGGVTLSLRGSYRNETSALTLCMLGNFACFCILPASIPSRATIRPPAKRHSNGVSLARSIVARNYVFTGLLASPPPPKKKKKIFQELSECQTIWTQIRTDVLSDLIWVQTVCKCYQQTTKSPLASKEVTVIRQQQSIRCI